MSAYTKKCSQCYNRNYANATNISSLVMNGLADVDGFKIYIQTCVSVTGFPPLIDDL